MIIDAETLLWLALSALVLALWALYAVRTAPPDEESAVPSDPDVVIEADHVTMCFLLERDAPLSLKERVVRTLRHERRQEWFTALCAVSFTVRRGEVVGIVNDFFGHSITVSGLVTAQDLITQLKDRPTLGERVLIPANMLRHGEGVFLDDYTVEQVEQALGRRLTISETDGYSLCDAIFRQEP